jgi:2-polyprenyl-6-methoxyphenol hydroxylase-like FAD-dependent oxidoreductase
MIGKRAVIIGAGMAGLAAAGAVAGYFEKVVVLERDAVPAAPIPRLGTPQAKHVHGLLSGGQQALEELFPGFERNLEEAGAVPLRVGLDILSERAGYDPFPRRDLGRMSYYMSRPLLEQVVRRHVEKLPNVTICPQSRVTGIETTPAGDVIIGVVCEHPGEQSEMLSADLVIDASGRASSILACLESAGRQLPEKSTIGVDISYSTAIFELPDDASHQWKAVMTMPDAPRSKRRGVMFPLEGNRWMVTIGGMHGIKTPQDHDGFIDHLRGLRTQTIHNAVKHARRLGEIPRYGFLASEWRHFERLAGFPRGLLPMGDAFCRFNPVYGQGMSVAAQEAVLLRHLLATSADEADPLSKLAPRFFAGAKTIISGPWTMVGNLDFIWPETTGERPPDFEKILTFGAALTRLAAEDPAVHKLTVEVQHLLKPLSVLREPALLDRVLSLRAVA